MNFVYCCYQKLLLINYKLYANNQNANYTVKDYNELDIIDNKKFTTRSSKLTDFIKVERKFAGQRAVQPSFTEWCPRIPQHTCTAAVIGAHSRHTRKHRLNTSQPIIDYSHFTSFFHCLLTIYTTVKLKTYKTLTNISNSANMQLPDAQPQIMTRTAKAINNTNLSTIDVLNCSLTEEKVDSVAVDKRAHKIWIWNITQHYNLTCKILRWCNINLFFHCLNSDLPGANY